MLLLTMALLPARAAVAWEPSAADLNTPSLAGEGVDPIANRYLAFGDSITYGGYVSYPYPEVLNDRLDLRVALSDVINAGVPGEKTLGGSERIGGQVSTHRPQVVLIMEGTNDVTAGKLPADVYNNLVTMIDNARNAGVDDVKVMLATIVPRLDHLDDENTEMNQLAVIPAARDRGVPLCDVWRAFKLFGPLEYLFEEDGKHPNSLGLRIIAYTFYDCLLASYPEIEEETTPPIAWIESLPPSFECGQVLTVRWNGSDNLTWVVDYDVQAKVKDGSWTDWSMATSLISAYYPDSAGGRYGDLYGFRARGRDLLGNEGDYGEPSYTQVGDSVPPYAAGLLPLPPFQALPFAVHWWGQDACADVVAYDVQYRAGPAGLWTGWLTGTISHTGTFDPDSPDYGQTYEFRARAQDAAGNWGTWSAAQAPTTLARYRLSGSALNVRGQPIAFAQVLVEPAPLWIDPLLPGEFVALLGVGGEYDITVSRDDRYGTLPAMHGLPVDGDVTGLQFVLPPLNDVVTDGGFEASSLDAWRLGGGSVPAWTQSAHTGQNAVRFGGPGSDSILGQTLIPAPDLAEPTLSFMVRLPQAGPTSTLQVELSNNGVLSPPVTYTLEVADETWRHVWYDLTGLAGEPLTLTLVISDSPEIVVDEISLGSARPGSYPLYVPLLWRQ